MRRRLAVVLLALGVATACRQREGPPAATASPKPAAGERKTVLLSGPWRFQGSNDLLGAEAPAFDDRAWPTVTVPHTWGERPWRRAWYRTHLVVPPGEAGRPLYLVFEGAATFADVYLNGTHLGQRVSAASADLAVKVLVRNAGDARRPVEVRCRLLDAAGQQVVVLVRKLEIDGGASVPVAVAATVTQPRRWSPADPYLYRLRAEVVDGDRLVDAVEQRTGCATSGSPTGGSS